MPQRFLRPGITTSDPWNSVSFGAQSFYIRILTLVDDFGRYDGRVPILHGQCFALRDDVKPQHTAAFRSELQQAGLILVYEADGKEYLQITKWQERARGDRSKYPEFQRSQESAAERSGTQEKDASLAIASSPSPSPAVKASRPKPAALSDEDWIASLSADPVYRGLNVKTEHGKMVRWCEVNHRQPTRKAFVNWLNRAERPMNGQAQKVKPSDML